MASINLTKGGFMRRVANYEQNVDNWKFLGDKPALIDFHAKWCAPCRSLSPIIDELAQEYHGKVDIYKVNVDDEPELSSLFNIRTIPTLVFIPMNDMPHIVSGAYPKQEISHAIDTVLLK